MGPQKKTNSRVSIFPYIAVSTDAHLMNLHLPSETKTDHQLNLTIFIQSQTIRVGNSSKIPSESFRASKKKKHLRPGWFFRKTLQPTSSNTPPICFLPKKTGVSGLRKSCRNSLPSGKTVRLRGQPTPVTRMVVGSSSMACRMLRRISSKDQRLKVAWRQAWWWPLRRRLQGCPAQRYVNVKV